ncbi:MAG: ABC transporter permease [Neomegalonema sp.]|nr:ABC transporter permease [Neomegalonema sp.]
MSETLIKTRHEARAQSASYNELEGQAGLWEGILNFMEVHTTLNLRFIGTKFRESFLGYAWMFITPMTWIVTMALVFVLLGRRPPIETDVVSFLTTGMIGFITFRETFSLCVSSVRTNRHLYYFGHVKYFDVVLSTAVVEFMTTQTVFWVILVGNLIIFGNFEIHDLGDLLLNFLLVWLVGLGAGYFTAMLAQFSSAVPRMLPIILRPLFWCSGLFFVAGELPQVAQDYLYYNPVLHCIEGIRQAAFINYESRFYDPMVPIWFAFGLFAAGQLLDKNAQRSVSVQQ